MGRLIQPLVIVCAAGVLVGGCQETQDRAAPPEGPSLPLMTAGGEPTPNNERGGGGDETAELDVDALTAFVRTQYAEGMPVDDARAFGPEALPILEDMLADPDFYANRPVIAGTIGAIGGEEAGRILTDFMASFDGRAPQGPDYQAGFSAVTALGYAAASGSETALGYLTDTATGTSESAAKPGLGLPASVLRNQAVQALGVSGTVEAGETLRELADDGDASAASALKTWMDVSEHSVAERLER